MDWQEIWNSIVNYFQSNVWNFFWFFVVLIAGIIVIFTLLRITKSIMRKRSVDPIAIRFTVSVLRFFLWLILLIVLLAIMGVPINGLTTTLSAVILAIGMALKEFLSNVASGIILVGSKKYKTGDFIQVAGVEGSIEDINFLFTTLKTPNSTQITLPNSTMVNEPVTNLGAYSSRRVAITFSVAYESDTELVKKTLLDVVNSCGMVYQDPAPLCRLKTLGQSSIDFFVTCYCDNADYWNVYYYVMEYGFDACKKAGIGFPFMQVEVTQKTPKAMPIAHHSLPSRVEKAKPRRPKKLSMEDLEDMTLKDFTERMKLENELRKEEKEKKKAAKKPGITKKSAASAAKEKKDTKK